MILGMRPPVLEKIKLNMMTKLPFVPRLKGLKSVRATYARILKVMAAGELDTETARIWIYAMSVFLAIAKTESEQDIIDQLKSIEKRLDSIEKGKTNESRKTNIRAIG